MSVLRGLYLREGCLYWGEGSVLREWAEKRDLGLLVCIGGACTEGSVLGDGVSVLRGLGLGGSVCTKGFVLGGLVCAGGKFVVRGLS